MTNKDAPLIQIGAPHDHHADEYTDSTRRRFLEVMGASIALAAGVGCTRPATEFLMPYVDAPEQTLPGIPKYYATAAIVNGIAQGVVVETHLGRPTKVEGNPAHPASLGATNVLSQACVLDLYDPFRSKEVVYKNELSSWDDFSLAFAEALEPIRAAYGRGLAILTETVISPSYGSQLSKVLTRLPESKWCQYDPAGPHSAREGAQMAFGRYVNTYYRLENADVIVSLDADFLTCGQTSTRYAHDFALKRRVRGTNTSMNRLYVAESSISSTGGKADHRVQLRYPEIGLFAAELASALGVPGVHTASWQPAQWMMPLVRDLLSHRGRSAIIVGDNQPPALHALAHAINIALGNNGKTVIYTEPIEVRPENQIASFRQLVDDMDAGRVKILLILGGNPVYNAPADISFAQSLARVPLSIHAGLYPDETSRVTHWHIPETHFLETWGDARAYDGTVTILQPMIEPLYFSHSHIEILDLLLQTPNWTSERIVRTYWQTASQASNFDEWWRKSVGSGLVTNSALPEITPPSLKPIDATSLFEAASAPGLDLVFRPDPYIYDGRYASNAWLQELPKHITKLTWDNAVHISPRTAKRLELNNQHIVQIKYRGHTVEGSVWISPGEADDTITVHLGYGRENAGPVGNGAGFNAYRIRMSDALWYAKGADIHPTGKIYPLATAQMQMTEEGRDLVVSRPIDVYRNNPGFVQQSHPEPGYNETLYPHWNYSGYNWGMAIDLTACVNCGSCVIACQAENNIPVIGKEQQLFNREMHWLRIDTYLVGDWNSPSEALYQPVPCMHCENAPCELVCPVQATLHSEDGLNDMIYNRCVGTRFCSNNCPYKVRRFNWMLYADWYTEQLKMVQNPNVTVRSRGVMEKCTYCVQRIREAEIRAEREGRFIRDGEIRTACQQVCPTEAIIFGDINNSSTRVSRMKREKLNYSLLADLNTRPHTTYLAELRNPNPEWEKA
jgi:Fe-S-cluster-containing dehydrogenase component/anaerobic selenocysteine-containing dehydrogenase